MNRWTADEMDRWEWETDQILGLADAHAAGCRCPECDPDYNDPRNYDNDPNGDDYR